MPIASDFRNWAVLLYCASAPPSPQGSDEFVSPTLDRRWLWNHQPRAGYWSLTERPGWLRLKAFGTVGGNASFFRAGNTLHQRHLRSEQTQVTAGLDITHMTSGQRAGLAHFNGGTAHNAIAVQKTDTVTRIITEDNDLVRPVATVPVGVITVDLIARTGATRRSPTTTASTAERPSPVLGPR